VLGSTLASLGCPCRNLDDEVPGLLVATRGELEGGAEASAA
jgi:hypothetical protein